MADEHEAMPKEFGVFVEAVETRLDKGAQEYGERSFDRPAAELVGEIMEELEDVCGWAFVLWRRLRALETGGVVAVAADEPDPEDPFLAAERERKTAEMIHCSRCGKQLEIEHGPTAASATCGQCASALYDAGWRYCWCGAQIPTGDNWCPQHIPEYARAKVTPHERELARDTGREGRR